MQLLILSISVTLISYLIGSISTAVLVSKLFRLPDPRTVGSKNPGSTNVLRVGGKLPAALTLLGDSLKGFIPVYVTRLYLPSFLTQGYTQWVVSAVFLATILGHLYPIFFKFKGGKGVATALGGLLGLNWALGLNALICWLLTAWLTGYSALAALMASVLMPYIAYKIVPDYLPVMIIVSILVFWRHRTNIKRLLNGTEPKIGDKN